MRGNGLSTQLVAMLATDDSLRTADLSRMNFITGECVDVNGTPFIAKSDQAASGGAGSVGENGED